MQFQSSIFIYLAFAISLSTGVWGIGASSNSDGSNNKFHSIPINYENAAITCGGVLNDTTKQIIYKPFTQVGNNERCVWIVAAPNASSYRIRMESDFEGQPDYLLSVAAITRDSYSLSNYDQFHANWTTIGGNTIVVTFHSFSNASSEGFLFEYEVVSSSATISPQSQNSIVESASVGFKHPPGGAGTAYSDNELTTKTFCCQ